MTQSIFRTTKCQVTKHLILPLKATKPSSVNLSNESSPRSCAPDWRLIVSWFSCIGASDWDILQRQKREGWGAKVIDRIAFDLSLVFPTQPVSLPETSKYMRSFAEAWPDGRQLCKRCLHNCPGTTTSP